MPKESKQYHSVTVNIILFTLLTLVLLLTVFLILPLFWDNDWHDYPDPQRASASATTAIASMEREMNKCVEEYKKIMDRLAKDEVVLVQDDNVIKVISKPGQPDANKVLMTIPVEKHEVPEGVFPEKSKQDNWIHLGSEKFELHIIDEKITTVPTTQKIEKEILLTIPDDPNMKTKSFKDYGPLHK